MYKLLDFLHHPCAVGLNNRAQILAEGHTTWAPFWRRLVDLAPFDAAWVISYLGDYVGGTAAVGPDLAQAAVVRIHLYRESPRSYDHGKISFNGRIRYCRPLPPELGAIFQTLRVFENTRLNMDEQALTAARWPLVIS